MTPGLVSRCHRARDHRASVVQAEMAIMSPDLHSMSRRYVDLPPPHGRDPTRGFYAASCAPGCPRCRRGDQPGTRCCLCSDTLFRAGPGRRRLRPTGGLGGGPVCGHEAPGTRAVTAGLARGHRPGRRTGGHEHLLLPGHRPHSAGSRGDDRSPWAADSFGGGERTTDGVAVGPAGVHGCGTARAESAAAGRHRCGGVRVRGGRRGGVGGLHPGVGPRGCGVPAPRRSGARNGVGRAGDRPVRRWPRSIPRPHCIGTLSAWPWSWA